MASIGIAPFVLKDASFVVDADNYETNVSQVEFTATTSQVEWKGLTPTAVFTDSGAPTWACVLSYAQDWTTPDSLSQYLMDHQGEKVTAVFGPQGAVAGDAIFTVDLIIQAGPIGGSEGAVAVGSVTLGCDGAPVRSQVP